MKRYAVKKTARPRRAWSFAFKDPGGSFPEREGPGAGAGIDKEKFYA